MSKAKEFEQKTVIIGDKEYTLQKPKIEERIKIRSRMLNAEELSQFVAYEQYLEKVVVNPKCKISDFEDDLKSLDILMGEVERFIFSDATKGKSKTSKKEQD